MGDAPIAAGGQEHHLSLPTIRTEGPAVAEHHRLSCAPVLVIDLRTVFRRDRAHVCLRFSRSGDWPDRPLGAIRTSNRPLNTNASGSTLSFPLKAYTRWMQARHGSDAHQRAPGRAP